MSDARWIDIDEDVVAASNHFASAVALHGEGGFDERGLVGYRNAGRRGLASEADLAGRQVDRRHKPSPGDPELGRGADLDETGRFRNRVTRSYGGFDARRIGPTMEAAARLAKSFAHDIARFREQVDPDVQTGSS